MPRISKRNHRTGTASKQSKIKYYRTAVYIRLSRKDGKILFISRNKSVQTS